MTRFALVLGVSAALCGGTLAVAQEEPPLRDPTDGGVPPADRSSANRTGAAAAPVQRPAIELRALVVARGRPGVALIDVGGSLHRVAQGDRLLCGPAERPRLEFEIVSLTKDEVRVSIPALGETVVLR